MKIDIQNGIEGQRGTGGVTAATTSAQKTASSFLHDVSGSDQIEISGISRLIHTNALDRTARIHELAAAVRGGTYQVNGAAVAKSILNETLAAVAAN